MNPIGITSWIWKSPLTTDRFPEIAQHVARLGFDLPEVPIEGTSDLDYRKAAEVIAKHADSEHQQQLVREAAAHMVRFKIAKFQGIYNAYA